MRKYGAFINDKEQVKKLVVSKIHEIYKVPPKHFENQDIVIPGSLMIGRNEFIHYVRTLYLVFEDYINTCKNKEMIYQLIEEIQTDRSAADLFLNVGQCLNEFIRKDGTREILFYESSREIITFFLTAARNAKSGISYKDEDDIIDV
jgi:hypothetical protein